MALSNAQVALVKRETQKATHRLDATVGQLASKAKALAGDMTRLAEKLERQGAGVSLNSLGEVQGLGPEVDRLVSLLCQQQREVERLAVLQLLLVEEDQRAVLEA